MMEELQLEGNSKQNTMKGTKHHIYNRQEQEHSNLRETRNKTP